MPPNVIELQFCALQGRLFCNFAGQLKALTATEHFSPSLVSTLVAERKSGPATYIPHRKSAGFSIQLCGNKYPGSGDDLKDPCPVFDGSLWHVFASSGTVTTETWTILHATAPDLYGPWTEHEIVSLPVSGLGVAAPGVIFECGVFHMFIQTEFMKSGGRCEHAVSNDGFHWVVLRPALLSMADTHEDGIYDPHPAIVSGQRYIVYSGMPKFTRVPQPDIYLA